MPRSEEEEAILKKVSERLRALREERGLTIVQLSGKAGVGVMTISQYENGERVPTLVPIYKISRFFGVSVDYLIGESDIRR